MSDITLDSLTPLSSIPNNMELLVSVGFPAIFGRLDPSALITASVAAAAANAPQSTSTVEFAALNLTMPSSSAPNSNLGLLLYQITDTSDLRNLLLLSLEIDYQDTIGSVFTFEIWSGVPNASGSTRLFSYGSDIRFFNPNDKYSAAISSYFSNSDLRKGIYINIINRLSSRLIFSTKVDFLAIPPPSNPVTIPTYVPPNTTYIGPSNLATVDVGPGQTFAEMSDAIPYLAPGFIMTVHPGEYFKPFSIPTGMNGFTIQASSGSVTTDIKCNGRGGWLLGYPTYPDNGPHPEIGINPFRLSQGKGFIRTNSPGTITGLSFVNCGGAYGSQNGLNISQGEAGIYAENFTTVADLHINRCAFDGCENGIFMPPYNAFGGPGSNIRVYVDHCAFSYRSENGINPDGHAHNVYISCLEAHFTNCDFYACSANTFKSRSPTVTANNCFFESGNGRAINYPSGGNITVTDCILSQRPSVLGLSANYISIADESDVTQFLGNTVAKFYNCNLQLERGNSQIRVGYVGIPYTVTVNFAPSDGASSFVNWYPDYGPGYPPDLSYDTAALQTGVTGIPFNLSGGGTNHPGAGVAPRPSVVAYLRT